MLDRDRFICKQDFHNLRAQGKETGSFVNKTSTIYVHKVHSDRFICKQDFHNFCAQGTETNSFVNKTSTIYMYKVQRPVHL
jgi:tRNA U38,U39,U40 pseudouridine synthase TruA